MVTNTREAEADFDYRATLTGRRLGAADTAEGWTTLASHAGTGHPERELALRFPAVQLPAGIHRLQLRLEVNLPASAPGARRCHLPSSRDGGQLIPASSRAELDRIER